MRATARKPRTLGAPVTEGPGLCALSTSFCTAGKNGYAATSSDGETYARGAAGGEVTIACDQSRVCMRCVQTPPPTHTHTLTHTQTHAQTATHCGNEALCPEVAELLLSSPRPVTQRQQALGPEKLDIARVHGVPQPLAQPLYDLGGQKQTSASRHARHMQTMAAIGASAVACTSAAVITWCTPGGRCHRRPFFERRRRGRSASLW
jgi:hypothetical protein